MMTNTNSEEATALARTVLPKMTEFPSYTWLIEASRRLNIPYHTVASAFIEENNRLKASTVGLSSAIISTPEELEAAKRELEATVRKAAPISAPVRVKKGYWPDGIEEVLATINKKKELENSHAHTNTRPLDPAPKALFDPESLPDKDMLNDKGYINGAEDEVP
jgi:hypothetical protein